MWEWEWSCVIPREAGGEGGGECVYEGGERVELPGRGEGRFEGGGGGEGGERFEVGVPLLFVVRMRVLEGGEGGGVVAEGSWERVFSVVGEEGGEVGLEVGESRWGCEGGGEGYLVRFFSKEYGVDSSGVFSLWAEVFGFCWWWWWWWWWCFCCCCCYCCCCCCYCCYCCYCCQLDNIFFFFFRTTKTLEI